MKRLLFASSALLTIATPASAAEYLVNISGNGVSATGSITTDGTVGVLSESNITDWLLSLDDGSGAFTLDGPSNSEVWLIGTALSATATDLLFDFSRSGFLLFQNPSVGSGTNFACFTGNSVCGGGTNRISITVGNFGGGVPQSGVQSIASIGSAAAVPEPSTWALMLLGFGFVGGAMRSARRREKISVSYA